MPVASETVLEKIFLYVVFVVGSAIVERKVAMLDLTVRIALAVLKFLISPALQPGIEWERHGKIGYVVHIRYNCIAHFIHHQQLYAD